MIVYALFIDQVYGKGGGELNENGQRKKKKITDFRKI
jgi:hypothetical protein